MSETINDTKLKKKKVVKKIKGKESEGEPSVEEKQSPSPPCEEEPEPVAKPEKAPQPEIKLDIAKHQEEKTEKVSFSKNQTVTPAHILTLQIEPEFPSSLPTEHPPKKEFAMRTSHDKEDLVDLPLYIDRPRDQGYMESVEEAESLSEEELPVEELPTAVPQKAIRKKAKIIGKQVGVRQPF